MSQNPRQLVVKQPTPLVPIDSPYVDHHSLRHTMRWPARIGLILIVMFVFGFGIWATVVPLAGGAIAPGVLSPDGSKRTVQHLEGGIIHSFYVRDGDDVVIGQPLLVLESVQPKAKYDKLAKQQRDLLITQARLRAESAQHDQMSLPPEIDLEDPETKQLVTSQLRLLKLRLDTHKSKREILNQRILQLKEQINGLEAQRKSAKTQLYFLAKEIAAKRDLRRKGLLTQPVLFRLLRMEAEIQGRIGETTSFIAKELQAIGEARLKLVAIDIEGANEIAVEADKTRAALAEIREHLLASKDILTRTVVRAPVNGRVVNLRYKTISGVVQPATPILDIVPSEEKLIIDARVSPMDIDIVRAGLGAQIQLSAYSIRSMPRIDGIVRSVSADRIVDKEKSDKPYYLARVEVDRKALDETGVDVELVPGMPADVLIVTEQRTLANYLLEPFIKAVWKSFREA